MADTAVEFFAGLKAGDEFIVRGGDGSKYVARVIDVEDVPGDADSLRMLRGNIEMRNFAYPSDAPEIAVKNGRP